NMIGKYVAPNGAGLITRKKGTWPFEVHLVKFDRRVKAEDKDPKHGRVEAAATVKEYIDGSFSIGVNAWTQVSEKKTKIDKLEAVEYEFSGKLQTDQKEEVRVYAMLVKLKPDCDVAFFGCGPGDDKKWGKFEDPYQQMGRSLKLRDMA